MEHFEIRKENIMTKEYKLKWKNVSRRQRSCQHIHARFKVHLFNKAHQFTNQENTMNICFLLRYHKGRQKCCKIPQHSAIQLTKHFEILNSTTVLTCDDIRMTLGEKINWIVCTNESTFNYMKTYVWKQLPRQLYHAFIFSFQLSMESRCMRFHSAETYNSYKLIK